jgi:hypothetical protein
LGAALVVPSSQFLLPDSREYLSIADNILAGRGIILNEGAKAKRPPVYPVFLASVRVFFPTKILPIQIVQALLGSLACLLLFLIGCRVFDFRVAFWASGVCALYPLLIFTGPAILIEGWHLLLLLAEVYFLLRAQERWGWGMAAGVAGGLAVLLHPGHALFFLAVLLFRRGKFLVPYLAAIVCIVGLWTGRNARVLEGIVPLTTQSGYALYEAFGPGATGGTIGDRMAFPSHQGCGEVEYDRLLRAQAFQSMQPARVAWLVLEKQRRFWSILPQAEEYRSLEAYGATLCFVPILILFCLGLWKWRLAPSGAGWILVPIVYYASLHSVFIGSIRYRLAIEPFLILIAFWGLSRLRRPAGGPSASLT